MVLARHVICILHDDLEALAAIVDRFPGFTLDREFSQTSPDDRMRHAFEASHDLVEPSFEDSDWAAIDEHRAVGYVLSPPIEPDRAREISADALRLVATALAGGARAVKGESSGIAHGAARWRTLAVELELPDRRDFALHAAWVRRPIADDDVIYTCGMHLLGRRDIEISVEVPPHEAIGWLDVFALYTLIEAAPDELADGHTFRPDDNEPRRPLTHHDCTRYPDDEFFYNPHGYWRLGDPIDESSKPRTKAKPRAKPTPRTKAKSRAKASRSKPKPRSKSSRSKATRAKPPRAKTRAKAKPRSKA